MLSEKEIRERAEYCYCVYVQLSSLLRSEIIDPSEYMRYLKKSSLQLGDDEFITMMIEDGFIMGLEDGGLSGLIHLYEGFTRAFCEVLEIDLEDIIKHISPDFLQQLTEEVSIKKTSKNRPSRQDG